MEQIGSKTTKFRKLQASDVDVRIGSVNKGGVTLLLYKDARVDQNILDETFGVFGWQRKHKMIGSNLYCTVSVKDPETGEWISKQDVGVESYMEKEKGQASDAFKRACFNLGIGRELYTAPEMFVRKEDLRHYKDDGEKPKCFDEFKVTDLVYDGDMIESVTIAICEYGRKYGEITFPSAGATISKAASNQASPNTASGNAAANTSASSNGSQTNPPAAEKQAMTINDDTVIKIGNCRGKKYGEAKNTDTFKKFLAWIRTATPHYESPEQTEQFNAFKKMSMAS